MIKLSSSHIKLNNNIYNMRYNKNCIGYQNKNNIKLMLQKKE